MTTLEELMQGELSIDVEEVAVSDVTPYVAQKEIELNQDESLPPFEINYDTLVVEGNTAWMKVWLLCKTCREKLGDQEEMEEGLCSEHLALKNAELSEMPYEERRVEP